MFISLTQFSVFSATLRESTGALTCQEYDAILQAMAFALVLPVRRHFSILTTFTHVHIPHPIFRILRSSEGVNGDSYMPGTRCDAPSNGVRVGSPGTLMFYFIFDHLYPC